MKKQNCDLSELMNQLDSDMVELSRLEMTQVNGGVSKFWYWLGCWANGKAKSMLEQVEDGVYMD